MNSYIKQFKKLNCYTDIIDILSPITNEEKEISESLSIIKQLKKIVLKNKFNYDIWDLCAGNALTSTISAFTLPIHKAYALDVYTRKRAWNKINNFEYVIKNIYGITNKEFKKQSIIISVHPCKDLAQQICNIYNNSYKVRHLILMPCCIGQYRRKNKNVINNNYYEWCIYLNEKVDGNITIDKKCLSPKNVIITASKDKYKKFNKCIIP